MDESVKIEILSKDISKMTNTLELLVSRVNELEKTLLTEVTRLKYRNGEFKELQSKVKELETNQNDVILPIVRRMDNKFVDNIIKVVDGSSRANRIKDMIAVSVISGVLVSVIMILINFIGK